MKWVKDMLTERDNETFDIGRFLCLISYIVYFVMALILSFTSHAWGALDFSGGIGAMAISFGIHFKMQ